MCFEVSECACKVFPQNMKLLSNSLTLSVSENFVYDSMGPSCVSDKTKTKFPSSQQHVQIARKL